MFQVKCYWVYPVFTDIYLWQAHYISCFNKFTPKLSRISTWRGGVLYQNGFSGGQCIYMSWLSRYGVWEMNDIYIYIHDVQIWSIRNEWHIHVYIYIYDVKITTDRWITFQIRVHLSVAKTSTRKPHCFPFSIISMVDSILVNSIEPDTTMSWSV